MAEHADDPLGERPDLGDGVPPRHTDEDRLVVASGQELDLAALEEVTEVADDVRTVALEPVEERSGEVHGRFHFGVPIESGHERRVRALGHFLVDGGGIPRWLVLVEDQCQTQTVGHSRPF